MSNFTKISAFLTWFWDYS